ncbi:Uncharacterised protein [Klebsiella pneumoniae subsp. rhinoscleromatis]|nr:Uncharacterised protein [Klebsiella pneumoniae subsp. rhinoscleromatis]
MFTALARGGLRLLAAAGGDNFYPSLPRSGGQSPSVTTRSPAESPALMTTFWLSWMPGVTLCLLTLFSIVQHPYEMPFVAHLQRGGRDHHRVLLGVHQQAGVNELIGEPARRPDC